MKNNKFYLLHIMEAILDIEDISKRNREDKASIYSVIKLVEIIGEASNNLTKQFISSYNEIPWIDIIGMRHKLVHDYFGVDLEELWKTVDEDIPVLKNQITNILNELKE